MAQIRSRTSVTASIVLNTNANGSGLTGSTNVLLPVDEVGALADATIDLGGATRFKDLFLSGGAYLGGTTSANLLNYFDGQTFTPTFPFLTLGNGSLLGVYQIINDICHFSCGFLVGSTSSLSGVFSVSGLPEIARNTIGGRYPVNVFMIETGVATEYGHGGVTAGGSSIGAMKDLSNVDISATSPFTWATGDLMIISGSYPIN